jgi:ABC-type transport system involved in multi-copper enzyme maturation permease subunit
MTELTGQVGFASPISRKALLNKRTLGVELIATLALAISLIVAATAVSFGVASAQSPAIARVATCAAHPAAALCMLHARTPTVRL